LELVEVKEIDKFLEICEIDVIGGIDKIGRIGGNW